ncbi:MAG TPA: heterodisulfide reductase-related iron-sulfur binding cluster [Fimbriimonadaceae bacterium]|nr:heterodisulfide reductase-related iron-sulfur binding cluster [Fimbriimonadaceae bacterium]
MSHLTDLTTQCIRCGFCLESCPTFLETGEETESPRGRIYLVRSVEENQLKWKDAKPHLDQCLGCRACETACPSGVRYGEILELARDELEEAHGSITKKALLSGMTHPKAFRLQLKLGSILPGRRVPKLLSRLLSGEAPEADRPRIPERVQFPPLDPGKLPPVRGHVYVLEGCVMRVLYPHVNAITKRLLSRIGFETIEQPQGCCGALHAHNGYLQVAETMKRKLLEGFPKDAPIIVNSAGCGSWLRDSGRAFDASEFLAHEGMEKVLAESGKLDARITYHDACHLAHGQGIRSEPRQLLNAIPGLDLVELPESEICCGSAGIYNLTQPKMARRLLNRKWANVESTKANIVATGNPGCHAWIAQASREKGQTAEVLHTLEVLEKALI